MVPAMRRLPHPPAPENHILRQDSNSHYGFK